MITPDILIMLLVMYGVPTVLTLIIATIEYLQSWDIEERQYYARMVLGAPFWPVALVWWIARYAPELIGRSIGTLLTDATRSLNE